MMKKNDLVENAANKVGEPPLTMIEKNGAI
jgi:hypothetical protein